MTMSPPIKMSQPDLWSPAFRPLPRPHDTPFMLSNTSSSSASSSSHSYSYSHGYTHSLGSTSATATTIIATPRSSMTLVPAPTLATLSGIPTSGVSGGEQGLPPAWPWQQQQWPSPQKQAAGTTDGPDSHRNGEVVGQSESDDDLESQQSTLDVHVLPDESPTLPPLTWPEPPAFDKDLPPLPPSVVYFPPESHRFNTPARARTRSTHVANPWQSPGAWGENYSDPFDTPASLASSICSSSSVDEPTSPTVTRYFTLKAASKPEPTPTNLPEYTEILAPAPPRTSSLPHDPLPPRRSSLIANFSRPTPVAAWSMERSQTLPTAAPYRLGAPFALESIGEMDEKSPRDSWYRGKFAGSRSFSEPHVPSSTLLLAPQSSTQAAPGAAMPKWNDTEFQNSQLHSLEHLAPPLKVVPTRPRQDNDATSESSVDEEDWAAVRKAESWDWPLPPSPESIEGSRPKPYVFPLKTSMVYETVGDSSHRYNVPMLTATSFLDRDDRGPVTPTTDVMIAPFDLTPQPSMNFKKDVDATPRPAFTRESAR